MKYEQIAIKDSPDLGTYSLPALVTSGACTPDLNILVSMYRYQTRFRSIADFLWVQLKVPLSAPKKMKIDFFVDGGQYGRMLLFLMSLPCYVKKLCKLL